jgi:hypothetical protein
VSCSHSCRQWAPFGSKKAWSDIKKERKKDLERRRGVEEAN